MKALTTGGNLQSLVEQSASKDIQALKAQLKQLSAFYGDIQAYLSQLESGKDISVEETSVAEEIKSVDEEKSVDTDVKDPIIEETF